MTIKYSKYTWIALIFCLISIGTSCGANEGVLTSGKATPGPTAEAKPDTFESDLAEVRKADFTWMYVIRRRDGGELDTKDKDLIRTATAQSNRRVLSDEGKAIIVGSNFEQVNTDIGTLKKQFEVTDMSTGPKSETSPGNTDVQTQ
jgi:hypothetical protein